MESDLSRDTSTDWSSKLLNVSRSLTSSSSWCIYNIFELVIYRRLASMKCDSASNSFFLNLRSFKVSAPISLGLAFVFYCKAIEVWLAWAVYWSCLANSTVLLKPVTAWTAVVSLLSGLKALILLSIEFILTHSWVDSSYRLWGDWWSLSMNSCCSD